MPKISKEMRLILIVLVIGGPIAVIMTNTPDAPPPVHKPHTNFSTTLTGASSEDQILPEDLTAHFPRYTGGARNPFEPAVVSGTALADASGTGGKSGSWSLTGINTIDGETTALVENSGSGDSVFLRVGDKWNGMRLTSIGTDSATFVDDSGHVTQLSFAETAPDTDTGPNSAPVATQYNLPTPVQGTAPTGGIAPFPVTAVAPLSRAQQ